MTDHTTSHRLTDKVAIITGGGTGIGRATAEAFVSEGAKVLIVGRREEPLKELAAEHAGNIEYFQADITKPGSPKAIVAHAIDTFGRLDVLINNAGIVFAKPLSMLEDDEINQMFATNITSLLALSREAIPALELSKGSIVNISSVAAQSALPGLSAYAATKSGIDRLSKILANELGPVGVRVNVVAPGLTRTEPLSVLPEEAVKKMADEATALRRVGEPEDVAQSIVWLASDQAAWVTGQIIQASGGLLLS